MKPLLLALICLASATAAHAAPQLHCDNFRNRHEDRVLITADVESEKVLRNLVIDELDFSNDTYGSKDEYSYGIATSKYVRFLPYGGANSDYKFALPIDFVSRKSFPLFLDSMYEGSFHWGQRRLSCVITN